MYKKYLAITLGTLLLAACGETGDSGKGDTGTTPEDTGCYEYVEPAITNATYECDSSSWTYTIELDGWAAGAQVQVMQTGAQNGWGPETHDMNQADYDPCGAWDSWTITLPIVSDYTEQEDGVNTLFQCNSDREATLTFMFTIFDDSGAAVDCWVGGDDPSYFSSYGCTEVTF